MKPEKTPETITQEEYFLNTFPLINLIILQKLNVFYSDYLEDIKQKVALKLWEWKSRRPEKELSREEWLKLTNTSTQNEIKRFKALHMSRVISLTEIPENEHLEISSKTPQTPSPVGNTRAEITSLLLQIWKVIRQQTLQEKFALLLKDREIVNHLISYRCCDISEIAASLKLTIDEFLIFYRSLPLSDAEIGLRLGDKLHKEINAGQISKARQRMRAKLRRFQVIGHGKSTNERTFVPRENKTVSE